MLKKIVSLGLVLGLGVLACLGQTPESGESFSYEYAQRGATTMDVYVWGAVGRPGIWKVESDIDLIELLSVAQVPGVGQQDPSIIQRVRLRIYRTEGGKRRTVYSQQLDQILASGEDYPSLQAGDIVEIVTQRRQRFGLQGVSQIIGTAATMALLIIRITRG